MTDYKALIDKAFKAADDAVENFEPEDSDFEPCSMCGGTGSNAGHYECRVCDGNGLVVSTEAWERIRTEAAAAVLRSALTPEWKDVPDELPEGATYGYYRSRNKKYHNPSAPIRWDRRDVAEERAYWAAQGELSLREFMLIAAFDAHDNPVANGEAQKP